MAGNDNSGRKKVYTETWAKRTAKQLPDMMKNGESIAEVCANLGMSKDTFYRCCNDYPIFSDAVKKGKTYSEAYWCKLGRAAAQGQINANPTFFIFNMKNRFNWRDKTRDRGRRSSKQHGAKRKLHERRIQKRHFRAGY